MDTIIEQYGVTVSTPPWAITHMLQTKTIHKMLNITSKKDLRSFYKCIDADNEAHVIEYSKRLDNNEHYILELKFGISGELTKIDDVVNDVTLLVNKNISDHINVQNKDLEAWVCIRNEPYVVIDKKTFTCLLHYPNIIIPLESSEFLTQSFVSNCNYEQIRLNINSLKGSSNKATYVYGCFDEDSSYGPYMLHSVYNYDMNKQNISLSRIEMMQKFSVYNKKGTLYDIQLVPNPLDEYIQKYNQNVMESSELMEDVETLLTMVKPDRLNDLVNLHVLANSIYNIDSSFLPLLMNFLTPIYGDNYVRICYLYWKFYDDEVYPHYGYYNLLSWVKEDQYDKYEEYRRAQMNIIFRKHNNRPPTTKLIAQLLKCQYPDYVYKEKRNNEHVFYCFYPKQHRWVEDIANKETSIFHKIEGPFKDEVIKLHDMHIALIQQDDEADQKIIAKITKNKEFICNKLDDYSFNQKIIQHFKEYCRNPNFENELNSMHEYIACEDGVMDFKLGIFRDGRPEDKCSISTGRYIKKFFNKHGKPKHNIKEYVEHLRQIKLHFKRLWPNTKVRNYKLAQKGAIFKTEQKTTSEQKLYIENGEGANGKSKDDDLMKNALGQYYTSSAPTLLTVESPESSKPRPDICQLRHVRYVSIQEPENKDSLKFSIIKRLTGGDEFCERLLYQSEMCKFNTAKTQFHLSCNTIPTIENMDYGSSRRVEVTEYNTRFVDFDPENVNDCKIKPYQNQIYTQPDFYDSYLFFIIDKWYEYHDSSNMNRKTAKMPDEIKNFTTDKILDNDIIAQYIKNCIVLSKEDFITHDDIWYDYCNWFADSCIPRNLKGDKRDTIKKMSKKLGGSDKKCFNGYKLASDVSDILSCV